MDLLDGKDSINASDIINVMKQMQVDILQKCVTKSEVLNLRGDIRQIDDRARRLEDNYSKANDLSTTIDNLNILQAKIKEMQLESVRNENRILEN